VPAAPLIAVLGLGACGFGLLGLGLAALVGGGSTLVAAGGVLGVAELIVLGRVIERRQSARLTAITLAIVQAGLGVAFIADDSPIGLVLIPLAALVVLPLSTESAEQFFESRPT
jgi:hypothetical protein